ncbi:MAG: GGDEF domain-containing protein [Lachnospiraceae bacterium]
MNSKQILLLDMKKHWHGYEMFLCLIAVLEALMMVYGKWHFDFSNPIRVLYYGCYIFLFCTTILVAIINHQLMKSENHMGIATKIACIYIVVLIFWTAVISSLDIHGGGYPVTYMTILAAVSSLVALNPVLYASVAILSSGCIVAFTTLLGTESLHLPFYINHVIFLIVVIAVQIRNFKSIREQYTLNNKLEEWAEIDALTRVYNRRALDNYIEKLGNTEDAFSFVLLDADNFKTINDTYGHQEGDQCLFDIASLLTGMLGEHVFRYGGDEFAVVSFEDASVVAEKMNLINQRLKEKNKPYNLQICAGIYHCSQKTDHKLIFECADHALYKAKQNGKARAVVYSKDI